MEEKERIPIFHLYRTDGTSLFLHPFDSTEKVIDLMEKQRIREVKIGYYLPIDT